MGVHKKGWWKDIETSLKALKRYDSLRGGDKTLKNELTKLKFIETLYDDEAVRLQEATSQAGNLGEFKALISATDPGSVDSATLDAWETSANTLAKRIDPFQQNAFLKDNVWDVFLVANKLTRHYLALHIAKQIIKEIQKGNPRENWGILAHSLGTALIQDVLNLIYEELSSTQYIASARVVALIANFSRTIVGPILVSRDPVRIVGNDKTHVWPGKNRHASACREYICARHALDPLSYLGVDMPEPWGPPPEDFNVSGYRMLGHSHLEYLPSELDVDDPVQIGSFNHSVENYFAYPGIHLPFIYRALDKIGELKASTVNEACVAFKAERGVSAGNLMGLVLNDEIKGDVKFILEFAKTAEQYKIGKGL